MSRTRLMWTSGTTLPETATTWTSPATLTWSELSHWGNPSIIIPITSGLMNEICWCFTVFCRRTMHVVRVIKCGGRRVEHTCCEGTMHICMRNNVSRHSYYTLLKQGEWLGGHWIELQNKGNFSPFICFWWHGYRTRNMFEHAEINAVHVVIELHELPNKQLFAWLSYTVLHNCTGPHYTACLCIPYWIWLLWCLIT